MAVPGTLTLSVESDDTAHVVRATGELDLNTRAELQAIFDGLAKPPLVVILDVAELLFIDSTGLKTILTEHRRARAERYEFVVTGAQGSVRETFRLTALDVTLPLAPDVAAVLGDSA